VRLEFGLQTIHKSEQEAIARPNNMKRVVKIMNELNSRHLNYEVYYLCQDFFTFFCSLIALGFYYFWTPISNSGLV